ncbi:MAG: hypothetical protein CMJ17_05575 [Phenylobacterium sp.]|nr:hypothetical protein [Phenylobacterium sp.]
MRSGSESETGSDVRERPWAPGRRCDYPAEGPLSRPAWIALARGAWDKAEHPRDHAALTVVVEALEAGEIVVPLSFTTLYETIKVDNRVRRTHLAHVQATISGGRVLRGRGGSSR